MAIAEIFENSHPNLKKKSIFIPLKDLSKKMLNLLKQSDLTNDLIEILK